MHVAPEVHLIPTVAENSLTAALRCRNLQLRSPYVSPKRPAIYSFSDFFFSGNPSKLPLVYELGLPKIPARAVALNHALGNWQGLRSLCLQKRSLSMQFSSFLVHVFPESLNS